ncbi:MAG: hypothetical protein ACREJC_14330, partial [Tepidisphaeraceae bacterium]
LGRFYFGGAATGKVYIGGSIDTFYCGALLTGDANGLLSDQTPTIARNFRVNGDIRNLVTLGSIGTNKLDDSVDSEEVSDPDYKTGVDIYVGGRLGQILTRGTDGSFLGAVTVINNKSYLAPGVTQFELEARTTDPREPTEETYFQGRPFFSEYYLPTLGDIGIFNNDSFGTAQFVGGARSTALNGSDVVQMRGLLSPGGTIDDDVDYYAAALMAGQTVEVQLLNGSLNVGVFDPDGRLVASDYANNDGTNRRNRPFRFTTDRPGSYRFAVAQNGDKNFDGVINAGETVGGSGSYELNITHLKDLAFGALVSFNNIGFTDGFRLGSGATRGASVQVNRGDLGAIISLAAATSDSAMFMLGANPVTVLEGNLRTLEAPSIGLRILLTAPVETEQDDPRLGIDLRVPKGSVGLIRGTGPDNDTQIVSVNAGFATAQFGPFSDSDAIGGDYQVIDAAAVFAGNLFADGGIGTIRADLIGTEHFAGFYAVNVDNEGNDGVIDLIDVRTRLGRLNSGGPAITTGDGGNVRFVRAPIVYRDLFFGGGGNDITTYNLGQNVNLTDDSGVVYRLKTIPEVRNTTDGTLVNPGRLTITTYGIRDKGGAALVRAIVNNPFGIGRGLQVDAGSGGQTGGVEIGEVEIRSPGTNLFFDEFARTVVPIDPDNPTSVNPTENSDLILKGGATIDVWSVVCT